MSNNGSDEIAATPEEQRRSFTEAPDRRRSCLKEHFQFYHTWSPSSLEEIDDGYGNIDENDNNSNGGAYPIIVAPPNYGPLQSPPPLSPRQKRYERQNNDNNNNATKQKTDAATNFLTALDIKGDSDTTSSRVTNSAPPVLNTPQRLKQSLNSLLSSPISNPLFDDDDETITHHKMLSPSLTNGDNDEDVFANDHLHTGFYHSDDAITSWIWKPEHIDHMKKKAEYSLSCTLDRGRAVHATEPLLGVEVVSDCQNNTKDCESGLVDTNLNSLYKATDVSVKRNNKNMKQPFSVVESSTAKMGEGESSSHTESYKLYQARHPSLAPLIYTENLSSNAKDDDDNAQRSILSIFDITPTHHQSLRELLRTDEFFSKPLFPNAKGHDVECIDRVTIHHELKQRMKPLSAWLTAANTTSGDDGASDETLCRCHKIFETEDDWGVQGDMPTIAQTPSFPYSTNLSDELGPEESKGDVSSPLSSPSRPQQQLFGDLRKWPLRERRLKRHQVGTTYRADVADFRIRFLALQLFHAVDFCHSRNVTLGDQLSPDKIFVQKDGWVRIVPPIAWKDVKNDVLQTTGEIDSIPQPPLVMNGLKDWRTIFHRQHGSSADAITSPSNAGYSDSIIPYIGYGDSPTLLWQKGLLTNLSYLMILNAAAGRTVGNQLNPPMLPWVTNFAGEIDLRPDNIGNLLSEKSPYWRDLSRSKFRLTKGDDQLDHTFQNLRHHIPETLSEITYTVYRARALPIHQLRSTIRQDFIAEHYPESIKKLYEWSPDEASIEFFVPTTPCPFKSLHKEMQDISLPAWCENTSDFINYHRNLLESEYVSKHLHLWIDLNFGEALTGARAVAEKNVPLYSSRKLDKHHVCQGDCHSVLSGAPEEKELRVESSSLKSLFVQLFDHRHPKKHSNLRNALRTKIHTAVNRERETVNKEDNGKRSRHDLTARRKRDISLIGVLLNDCYNAARVIPSPDVQSAITNLLYGSFDLHLSLNEQTATGKVFPFPKHMKEAYSILSKAQTLTLWRLPSDDASDENTLTMRSTGLEQVGNLIRNPNTNFIDDLPVSAVGLILPTLLQPLSVKYLEENCASSRPFSSFAENLCNYLVALSNKVPGEVLLPRLLGFLQSSSDGVGITEQLSKFFLSRPLIASMYSSSEAEYFVSKICRFLFKQLCAQEEDREIVLDRNTVGVFFTSLLAQDDVLGTSICCHYIIPLLVDNVELCSNRSCGNMIVKSIKSMLPFLPEDIIGVIICKKILRKIVPKVLSRRGATNVDNIEDVIFLTELMILLQHCLRHLGSENVVKYFFHTNSGSISVVLSSSLNWTMCSTDSSTAECDRSSYAELLKAARVLVCGMFRQIESHQLPFTILPLLESFCSLVNDSHLTNVLNESVLPRDGEQREEILSLPGVKDANAMLQEAFKVRDQEELKATCPSVADFLAFLNPPAVDTTHKGNKNEAIDIQKQATVQVEKDSTLKSDGVASLYRSISLSNNKNKVREPSDSTNGSSIEMLPSIDRCASKESVVENSTKIQRQAPYLLRNVSSFSRSSTDVQEKRHDKEKLDLVWLLGLHKQDRDEQIKYSWQPRLMLSAKLDIGKSPESDDSKVHIDCMATNQSESMLACGNSDGELLIFDLMRHPPALRTRHRIRHVRPKDEPVRSTHQVEFLEGGDLLACDGGIHLVDVETQSTISSLSPENAFISDQGGKPWMSEVINAFSTYPRSTSSAEILCGSMGEICAISSAYLYGIDMRCSGAITSRNSVVVPYKHTSQSDALFKSMSWCTGIIATKENSQSSRPSYKKSNPLPQEQESSFNFTCVTSYSGGGDWICVGSSSGHIHCIDRRRGKILACWRAHQKAIIYIKSISRYKVLSASADKTAVLWNIMSTLTPPQKISTIYNIPGKEHSMNVTSHHFREDGLVSIPGGDLILCAVTGRKTVFMAMPTELKHDGSAWEVKADRVVMSDCEGNPIPSSEKLRVSSVALLPCRQLVLLGCDGEIHVCL